jgi:hypothetical protein
MAGAGAQLLEKRPTTVPSAHMMHPLTLQFEGLAVQAAVHAAGDW